MSIKFETILVRNFITLINVRRNKYSVLIGLVFFTSCATIKDSRMDRKEALAGSAAPKSILDSMVLLKVKYFSFDKKIHSGQLVVNSCLASDVRDIFRELRKEKFPIKKVVPIVAYNWSDDSSMAANNTTCFNYRLVARTNHLSNHSFGRAIDINPRSNPAVHPEGFTEPPNSVYDTTQLGVFFNSAKFINYVQAKGWTWGGSSTWFGFKAYFDFQHFQKLN